MANKSPGGMKPPDTLIVYCDEVEMERYQLSHNRQTRNRHIKIYGQQVKRLAEKSDKKYYIELVVTNI